MKENINNTQKDEKKTQKSSFNTVAKILIVLLCVAIVVQICIMINLKIKSDETKRKNDNISQACTCDFEPYKDYNF